MGGIIGFIVSVYFTGWLCFFVSYCLSASMKQDHGSTENQLSTVTDAAKRALAWPKVVGQFIRKSLVIK